MKSMKYIFIVLIFLFSNVFAGGALSTSKGSYDIQQMFNNEKLLKAKCLINKLNSVLGSLITREDIAAYLEELPDNDIIKTKIYKIKSSLLDLSRDINSENIDLELLYELKILISAFEKLNLSNVSYTDVKKFIHLIEFNLNICPDNELTLKEFAQKNHNIFYLVCVFCFGLNVIAAIYNVLETANY